MQKCWINKMLTKGLLHYIFHRKDLNNPFSLCEFSLDDYILYSKTVAYAALEINMSHT